MGGALGVVLFALVLAFLMRRRRIRRSQAGSQTSKPAELAISAATTFGAATELPGNEASIEMPVHLRTTQESSVETLTS